MSECRSFLDDIFEDWKAAKGEDGRAKVVKRATIALRTMTMRQREAFISGMLITALAKIERTNSTWREMVFNMQPPPLVEVAETNKANFEMCQFKAMAIAIRGEFMDVFDSPDLGMN